MRDLIAAVRHPGRYNWGLRPWTRHSIVLIVAGIVYVAVGTTYITTAPTPTRTRSLALAIEIAPLHVWGFVWIIAGLAVVASSRWPPASEKWGYAVLSTLSAWWAVTYALSTLLGAGPASSASGALVWALMAFLWWAIAGLWNPDPQLVRLAPRDSMTGGPE